MHKRKEFEAEAAGKGIAAFTGTKYNGTGTAGYLKRSRFDRTGTCGIRAAKHLKRRKDKWQKSKKSQNIQRGLKN